MLIYKKESQADINNQSNFILSCTEIVSDIITLPNNPWATNADPVRYWIANGQDRLGELQIRIIKFMHQNYFRFGKPVYLKARSISERMGESTANIGRAITALVERGILIRLHFMMDSNNRSMILPGTKDFQKFIKDKPIAPPSSVFFPKLPKHLRKSNRLYNILLYFKKLYLNFKVNLQNIKTSIKLRYSVSLGKGYALSDGKPLLQKLRERIKIKPPAKQPPVKPPVSEYVDSFKALLKKHNFDITKLSVRDKNDVAELINYRMMIDIRKDYLRDLTAPVATSQKRAENLLYRICWMFVNDIDLDIEFTDRALSYWNSLVNRNTRISSHKINHDTKGYTNNAIILTYGKHRLKEEVVIRTIDRLFQDGYNHKYATFIRGKIKLEDVFLNVFNKKIWHTMIHGNDRDWAIFVKNDGYVGTRHPEETQKTKDMFVHIFFNDKSKGDQFVEKHTQTIALWVTRLIYSFESQKRDVGGLGLVFPKDNGHPSVLFEFLMWYNQNRPFEVLDMQHMTSKDAWGNFISHMRLEWNDNFWKRASEMVNK
jgi:hypothetical protein